MTTKELCISAPSPFSACYGCHFGWQMNTLKIAMQLSPEPHWLTIAFFPQCEMTAREGPLAALSSAGKRKQLQCDAKVIKSDVAGEARCSTGNSRIVALRKSALWLECHRTPAYAMSNRNLPHSQIVIVRGGYFEAESCKMAGRWRHPRWGLVAIKNWLNPRRRFQHVARKQWHRFGK